MYQRDCLTTFRPCRKLSGAASHSLLSVSLSFCASLSVKVNGVSPELTAVATGVPIDPTHSHQRCSPYGTAEGVCVRVIGISSLDCDSVCGMCVCVCVSERVCVVFSASQLLAFRVAYASACV